MADVNAFVGVLQQSNVQEQSFALIQSYGTMIMNVVSAGGILGVASFVVVILLFKFVLTKVANFPSTIAWVVAGILAIITAGITVVAVYGFLFKLTGGI